jgi:hypothetical protein
MPQGLGPRALGHEVSPSATLTASGTSGASLGDKSVRFCLGQACCPACGLETAVRWPWPEQSRYRPGRDWEEVQLTARV